MRTKNLSDINSNPERWKKWSKQILKDRKFFPNKVYENQERSSLKPTIVLGVFQSNSGSDFSLNELAFSAVLNAEIDGKIAKGYVALLVDEDSPPLDDITVSELAKKLEGHLAQKPEVKEQEVDAAKSTYRHAEYK